MYLRRLVLVVFLLSSVANAEELLIYGGENHEEFLGCLNCPHYKQESICNRYGKYGREYSQNSIFNRYGKYGRKHSPESPWNTAYRSSSAPILKDRYGKDKGYLSIKDNRYDTANSSGRLKELYNESGGDLRQLRNKICD